LSINFINVFFSGENFLKEVFPRPLSRTLKIFCYKIDDCYALSICNSSRYHFGSASQNGPQNSFHMEILCFYVNGPFGTAVSPLFNIICKNFNYKKGGKIPPIFISQCLDNEPLLQIAEKKYCNVFRSLRQLSSNFLLVEKQIPKKKRNSTSKRTFRM